MILHAMIVTQSKVVRGVPTCCLILRTPFISDTHPTFSNVDMPRDRFEPTPENSICKVISNGDLGMYENGFTAGEALARFSENLRSPDRSSRSTSAKRREERSRSASRSGKEGVVSSAGGGGSATKPRRVISRSGGDSPWGDGDDKDRLSMATIRSQVRCENSASIGVY